LAKLPIRVHSSIRGSSLKIHPDATFHLAIIEGSSSDEELRILRSGGGVEQHFLLQLQSAAQANAAFEPDFRLSANRQTEAPRQRQLLPPPLLAPVRQGIAFIACRGSRAGIKIELGLQDLLLQNRNQSRKKI
jgi:hypothetical protein